ncbi:unnamed protein product [Auanema sp. JU1783]|nr:unnamed protein product [Auanema sp. JU1783]
MPQPLFTTRVERLKRQHSEVSGFIFVKYIRGLDLDTMELYNRALMESIDQIQTIIINNSEDGHLNPRLLTPDVNERSATLTILARLKKLVRATCRMTFITNTNNEPIDREAEAGSTVEDVLDRLFAVVSPECYIGRYRARILRAANSNLPY